MQSVEDPAGNKKGNRYKKIHPNGFSVLLPWPPSILSPNYSAHWRAKADVKREYRQACFIATISANKKHLHSASRAVLKIHFFPPTKQRYDIDNLLARMKSGIDGFAAAIKTDDSKFEYEGLYLRESSKNGAVVITVRLYR